MASELTRKPGGALAERSSRAEIDAFLGQAGPAPSRRGRLIFALDATLSRQPTWDRACRLQGEMFGAVGGAGSLAVQLVYYRGFGECRSSRWVVRSEALRDLMTAIDCRGGQTQIGRILTHARREAEREAVSALVFIGDAVEEDPDELCRLAGELGVRGVRCFVFQDGREAGSERCFREIARLTGGAFMCLDDRSGEALRNLLKAVGAFAVHGVAALEGEASREGRLLLAQVRGTGGTTGK